MTFDIDANGILKVAAKDKATGKEQSIVIQAGSGLGEDEIQNMVRDAESHAADDKRRREEIDARNEADSLAYQVEKYLSEHADKVEPADKTSAEEAVKAVRSALEGGNPSAIQESRDRLNKVWSDVMARVYQKTAQAGEESASPPPPPAGDATGPTGQAGPVDADFEVVEDDKGRK